MIHTCKNCGNTFEGNFCNNCGQPAHLHPINAKYIWHDIQHGLFHYDKGIIYTQLQLLLRPGHTVRDYINGKRIRHFSPVALVVVMAALYGLLYHSLHIDTFRYADNSNTELDYETLNEWISKHYSIFTLITIPYYAFFSWLMFRRHSYNFSEHIILNSFLAAQRLSIAILSIPFLYYAHSDNEISLITGILSVIYIILAYRGFSQFFTAMQRWKVLLLTTLCYLLSVILMTLCLMFILKMVS